MASNSNNRNDEYDAPRVYPIPENFADGTGVFGGLFPTRNFIEGIIFAIPALLFALSIPGLSLNSRIPVVVFSVSPWLILGCLGINGDSVTKFLGYFIKYRKQRRVARYNPRVKLEFTGDLSVNIKEVPIDKLKKMMVNLSRKDQQKSTESDRYYAVGRNVVFEDDIALQKKLSARAERSKSYGNKKKAR